MCGKVGNDTFGDDYRNQLIAEGVDTTFLQKSSSQSTGIACISVEDSGKNCITIIAGANDDLSTNDIDSSECHIREAKVLLCQNEISQASTLHAIQLAKKHNTIAVFNPAPVSHVDLLLDIIKVADIVCPNEVELSTLASLPTTTDEEVEVAARRLLDMGCKLVVVTLGERGAMLVSPERVVSVATTQVKAVDTVGAGDSFIGD